MWKSLDADGGGTNTLPFQLNLSFVAFPHFVAVGRISDMTFCVRHMQPERVGMLDCASELLSPVFPEYTALQLFYIKP